MGLQVLVVDDDKKLLSVLKRLLLEEGHEVKTCPNGLEAIKTIREQIFDLIITDLMMPGATGMDVLKESRKLHPDSLVILVTGFASLETAVEAIREGAYDYITKPFKLEEFKVIIKNAKEKILLIRENRRLLDELQEAHRQLSMVRKIMGGESKTAGNDENEAARKKEQLIAGSMLSTYYQENRTGSDRSLLSELERISTLKERELLTEEEFNLCKSRLLQHLKQH
jgi:DNA-binding NtrC family response regulator